MKLANITPLHKKGDSTIESNYRPVSILPATSKVFERILQKQILSHMDKYLSPLLCGFRKGFKTEDALLRMLEKIKQNLDKKGYAGAILMDLSKAFDTLNHDLLLAKLHAYGFHKKSLRLLDDYLKNRFFRTKCNSAFSTWTKLLLGVPQGSVLGPLLFNIYLNDLFYLIDLADVCNFADDTTLFSCEKSVAEVIRKLEHDFRLCVEWFNDNCMKLNEDKCHFIFFGHKYEHLFINTNNGKLWEEKSVSLLGIEIDSKLSFNSHLESILKTANKKLNALYRMLKFLKFDQKRVLMKAFVESQFNYCALICGCSTIRKWKQKLINFIKELCDFYMMILTRILKSY